MEQLAMGLRQAAEAVGLSHWTLRAYARQGKIRAVRIGRRLLIEPAELQRLIEAGRIGDDRNGNNVQNLGA
jgi:excisionase family DNA binding protein